MPCTRAAASRTAPRAPHDFCCCLEQPSWTPPGFFAGRYRVYWPPGLLQACAFCGCVLFAVLFVWKGRQELRANSKYEKVSNCTVVNATLDAWLCCDAQGDWTASCGYTCWAPAGCGQMRRWYDGARDPGLVAHPGNVPRHCCGTSCCVSEYCTHDDNGGGYRRLGGDDGGDDGDGRDAEAADGGNSSLALLGGCTCDVWGKNTNRFSCDVCYAGVVETRFHTAGTPEFYDVGWTRSDEEIGACYGATSRACADAFLDAHPRGAAGRCFYDPASRDARGHHVIAFALGYTRALWWSMALLCCCGWCCCACGAPRGSRPTPAPQQAGVTYGETMPLVAPEMPQPSAPPLQGSVQAGAGGLGSPLAGAPEISAANPF